VRDGGFGAVVLEMHLAVRRRELAGSSSVAITLGSL
jgi:hypothetical protein